MKRNLEVKRIKVIIPVSTDMWNEAVKGEMEQYKDDNTKIDVVNVKEGPESVECTYDEIWAELPTLLEAEKAEREGYDGVIIYCFSDPGLRAAKERLNIPIVGLNEASVHLASILGNRFSIITTGPADIVSGGLEEKLKLYGFEDKCASIRSIMIPVLDLRKGKGEMVERLCKEAKKATDEDGADTIVLGCGSIIGIKEKISEKLKVPVVVPGIAALKICEDLIDMKIAQSKRCFVTPPAKKRVA